MKQKKKGRFKDLKKAMQMELREHKSSFYVYVTLRVLIIVIMVLQLLNRHYESAFLCGLSLILLTVPSFVQVTFKIEFPTGLEIIMLLFVFAAEILGEISDFYLIFPHWDTILHTLNGFLAAAIGFSLVDILNRSDQLKFDLSPLFVAIIGFCFSMTIGVIWEFFEFGMDQIFRLDMQKDTVIHAISSVALNPEGKNIPVQIKNITDTMVNGQPLLVNGYLDIGLIDTMYDLLVNFIGAVVFSVFGYFYIQSRDGNGIAGRFIPSLKAEGRDFLKRIREEAEERQEQEEKKE